MAHTQGHATIKSILKYQHIASIRKNLHETNLPTSLAFSDVGNDECVTERISLWLSIL